MFHKVNLCLETERQTYNASSTGDGRATDRKQCVTAALVYQRTVYKQARVCAATRCGHRACAETRFAGDEASAHAQCGQQWHRSAVTSKCWVGLCTRCVQGRFKPERSMAAENGLQLSRSVKKKQEKGPSLVRGYGWATDILSFRLID